jgi:hypothetical protein
LKTKLKDIEGDLSKYIDRDSKNNGSKIVEMLDQEKEGQGQGLFASLLHVITMKSNCDI